MPSVPADPNSTDECCEVCRDKFDQFFNEEKEEWHLKNAIRIEDKTYHPVCYEDYQVYYVVIMFHITYFDIDNLSFDTKINMFCDNFNVFSDRSS